VAGLGFEGERLVVADDRAWIPLETVSIRKGFAQAWVDGIASYQSHATRDSVNLISVTGALRRFGPAIPNHLPAPTTRVDERDLVKRIAADLDSLRGWRQDHLKTLQSAFAKATTSAQPTTQGALQVARVYFDAGDFGRASRVLEEARVADAKDPILTANLGASKAAQGMLGPAVSLLEQVLTVDPSGPGIWLNLGLVHYAGGDTARAMVCMVEGLALAGGYDRACVLLRVTPQPPGSRGSAEGASDNLIRSLLKEASDRAPGKLPTRSGLAIVRQPGSEKSTAQSPSGSDRLLTEHLYWSEP
jgi:tetratricopeptide (TPR) repeat protein